MRSVVGSIAALLLLAACGSGDQAPLKELQRAKSGPLNVVLLSPGDAIKQGKGTFVIEFRDAGSSLVDVGTVEVRASMPMAGMAPMFGDCMVTPDTMKGRYKVSSDLGMAGTWRLQIAWDGPAGKGSASLPGTVL
jgi:hypothetical protein